MASLLLYKSLATYLGDLSIKLVLKLTALLGNSSLGVLLDGGQLLALFLQSGLHLGVYLALFVEQLRHLRIHIACKMLSNLIYLLT